MGCLSDVAVGIAVFVGKVFFAAAFYGGMGNALAAGGLHGAVKGLCCAVGAGNLDDSGFVAGFIHFLLGKGFF